MPDPKYTKPWHGVPRETIEWHPTVDADACIGCGTCVTGCSRMVYRYDFERRKAVVADPLNCMVGCTTCANTCPTHAISFPSLDTVFRLEAQPEVRHAIEDDLVARRDDLAWPGAVPHADRIINLKVAAMTRPGPHTLLLTLRPLSPADALCQFMAGQYLELLPPQSGWLSRAYSIGNASRDDGSVELQVRRVPGGRMTEWLFDRVQVGDVLHARGPQGHFTFRSEPGTPLAFAAGGTGFAPVKAMIEQQLGLDPQRDIVLFWGVGSAEDLYEVDEISAWAAHDANLHCILAIEHGAVPEALPTGIRPELGKLADAILTSAESLAGRDVYVAGPPVMMPAVLDALTRLGVQRARVLIDSFGV
ncbi:MAG: FAD-binding oxidoreductase [Dehalococcoidia bacterium]